MYFYLKKGYFVFQIKTYHFGSGQVLKSLEAGRKIPAKEKVNCERTNIFHRRTFKLRQKLVGKSKILYKQ